MRNNSLFYVTAILVCGLGSAERALAQVSTDGLVDAQSLFQSGRLERQLALSEASQTIQRFFTCIAEGVNSEGDPVRDARAAACQRAELHPNAIVVFNGIPLNGADAIVGTFTGQGPGAQQFANTILDVHTIVDKESTTCSTPSVARTTYVPCIENFWPPPKPPESGTKM